MVTPLATRPASITAPRLPSGSYFLLRGAAGVSFATICEGLLTLELNSTAPNSIPALPVRRCWEVPPIQ